MACCWFVLNDADGAGILQQSCFAGARNFLADKQPRHIGSELGRGNVIEQAQRAGTEQALQQTSDDHLKTMWQLKAGGQVVHEAPRFEMLQDTFNHWAHHRGQLTVYLRLLGATVPAIYGPSADDKAFR